MEAVREVSMLRIAMLAIAVLSVSTAVAAEQGGRPRRDATKHEAKKPNPCAAQGPGFTMSVRMSQPQARGGAGSCAQPGGEVASTGRA